VLTGELDRAKLSSFAGKMWSILYVRSTNFEHPAGCFVLLAIGRGESEVAGANSGKKGRRCIELNEGH
jgi:hypothetical protein